MGDRYVKSDENKKILFIDANILEGISMSQTLPYDEIELWHDHPDLYMKKMEEMLITSDDSDVGYFVELDLRYPDNIKEKTKNFFFCSEKRKINPDKYNDYMNNTKPQNYTKAKKLKYHWTDKKIYLILYRMLKLCVRRGMVVDKIHEVVSFEQSKWLEKYFSFNTQKRNRAKNEFEKDFYILLNNAFYEKTREYVRNRIKLEFIKNFEYKKIIKQQSKLKWKLW